MKFLISIFILFFFIETGAQTSYSNNQLVRYVIKHFDPPIKKGDTCYSFNSLILIEINKKSEVVGIKLSDNTDIWIKNSLIRAKENNRIDFEKMNAITKEEKIKNKQLVFPFSFVSAYECIESASKSSALDDNKFYEFEGEKLKGNIVFCDIVVIGSGKPSH